MRKIYNNVKLSHSQKLKTLTKTLDKQRKTFYDIFSEDCERHIEFRVTETLITETKDPERWHGVLII